jgi:anti-anti-sigma factor
VPDAPFSLDFDATAGVLAVSGDLDDEPTAALRTALEEHSQGYAAGLVLDLSGVTYLPSAAVGALAKAGQQFAASGSSLELAAASGSVAERVLTVCAMPHRSY